MNKDYEPVTEIIIHVGERSRDITKREPLRVYINGEQIPRLTRFEFKAAIDSVPTMLIEGYVAGQNHAFSSAHSKEETSSPEAKAHDASGHSSCLKNGQEPDEMKST